MSPRTGRPKIDNPKSEQIKIRATKQDKELLEKEGFDTTVIFIVVNMDQVKDMKIEDEKTVKALESVMEVTC